MKGADAARQVLSLNKHHGVSGTCGSVGFQQLQTRLAQLEPVPGVEGQQAAQLLQGGHPGSKRSKVLIDADL